MSSYAAEITTLLSADMTLAALLTGGVHDYSGLGRKGLQRIQTMEAYNAQTGLLKPVCIVLETNETADEQIVGAATSTVTPVYTWIYDHGDNGYSTIETAFNRMYTLLHLAHITGAVQVLYRNVLRDKRGADLKDAAYFRAQWNVYGYRT